MMRSTVYSEYRQPMLRWIAITAIVLVSVAGCSRGSAESRDDAQPPAAEEPVPGLGLECLPVADSLVSRITDGLIEGVTISSAGAVRSPERSEVWFVAAQLAGEGFEQSDVAVFATSRGNDDSQEGVIIGVGGFAAEFSNWPKGDETSFALSITEEGVDEAISCLLG